MAKNRSLNGISCNIYKAKNETEHFHQDVEMVFVIEGRIRIVVDNNEFIIGPEEILLINSNKLHYASVMEDALICRINISYNMLLESLGDEYVAFWCNTLTEGDISYTGIRDIIRKIILLKLDDSQKDTFRLMEFYSRLINIFIRNFKVNNGEWNQERSDSDTDRIKQVINYINLNYHEPISLQNLADRLYAR